MRQKFKSITAMFLCIAMMLGLLGMVPGTITTAKAESSDNAFPPIPEMVQGDWTVKETGHPRVYFTAAELEEIKKFAADESLSAYGYSGKSAMDALLQDADAYLAETEMDIVWGTDYRITFPLSPVLEDASDRQEFRTPPAAGAAERYPYMTRTTEVLQTRMQTLALAYAITGEAKYGERAVQYATDMSKWQYWVGKFETIEGSTIGEKSAQPTYSCIVAVATVYDMCFALLTPEQKSLIENALITKGLEPMENDVEARMARGRDMDHMPAAYVAGAAILTEENKATLQKYLDRAVQYTTWIFNWYENGHNEGYDYALYGIDKNVLGMGAMTRVTGQTGQLNHNFIQNVLPDWILGFFETGKGTLPAYSDSSYVPQGQITMSVLNKLGNAKAGYYLSVCGDATTPFDKLIFGSVDESLVKKPDDDTDNVTTVEVFGLGSLRTGWGAMDNLLVLFNDDYAPGHAHFESNSIYFAAGGDWIIKDVGYASQIIDSPQYNFDRKYASNTIFVDGNPQSKKMCGTITKVFDNALYGYIKGSAPDAYGMDNDDPVLSTFDRHTIMVNHDDGAYYVVLDDLASSKERVYGFNSYYGKWEAMELDGERFDAVGTAVKANHVAMLQRGKVMHTQFVGEPLDITAKMYEQTNVATGSPEAYGPYLLAEGVAAKEYQFMTVLSVDQTFRGFDLNVASSLLASSPENDFINEAGLAWSTKKTTGNGAGKAVVDGEDMIYFRGAEVGDWIGYEFNVAEAGTYNLALRLVKSDAYGGKWRIYLDGEPLQTLWDPRDTSVYHTKLELGVQEVSAGKHTVKLVLEEKKSGSAVSLCGFAGASLMLPGGLGDAHTQITQTFDTETVLGAEISYAEDLNDIILFNRGTGSITAGGVTTDAKQASILAISGSKMSEGFAVTGATTLSHSYQNLFTATKALNMVADYTGDVATFDIDSPEAQTVKLYADRNVASVKVGNSAAKFTKEGNLIVVEIPAGESVVTLSTVADEPVTPPAGGETVTPPAGDVPPTGDDSHVALLAVVMMLAAAAFVTTKVKFGFGK